MVKNVLHNTLLAAATSFLILLAYCAWLLSGVIKQTEVTIKQIGDTVRLVPNQIDSQVGAFRSDLNGQLFTANKNLAKLENNAGMAVDRVSASAIQSLAKFDANTQPLLSDATLAANGLATAAVSANTLISDKDIPALIRDARQTTAMAGRTSAAVEATANTIQKAVPTVTANVERITGDTALVADGIAKKRSFWRRLVDLLF